MGIWVNELLIVRKWGESLGNVFSEERVLAESWNKNGHNRQTREEWKGSLHGAKSLLKEFWNGVFMKPP